jgi:hypothetical protein
MGKCRKGKGKLRALQYYGCKTSKALGKVASNFSDWSHKQSEEHKTAWALFFVAVIGLSLLAGAVFLYQGNVANPTPSQVTYAKTYTLSNGTVVPDKGTISGTLKCVLQPGAAAGTESCTWRLTSLGNYPMDKATPYWITSVNLKVYSGSSATGTPKFTGTFAVDSADYASTMQTWATNFWNTIKNNPINPNNWVLGDTPTANPTWTIAFDTRVLPNGLYTFQIVVTWGLGTIPTTVTSMVSGIPASPPSLSSTSGEAYILSTFGLGIEIPEELLPIVFIGVIAIAAVAILLLRRRS